ncbi:hypothetical protein GCM10007301_01860 [Azorhizobium oxalatiphilum]|uniref:Nif11 domain-containing protein n=1 Tax=Azorhizobium oxalatiphilum TaxID=980631 RepID=A0A917F4K9_9HYPH|nr:Nif11-like leader peptide family RiPP precursor [Azorhizobium oxalatiphilum]GGF45973.1 hypothetical protein GCM10007301_01860 [Azorhizobium oxalatiphilum]
MSSQELQRLSRHMSTDPELKAEVEQMLSDVSDANAASDILRACGYDVSAADLSRAMAGRHGLSDDQLDDIVGGGAALSVPFGVIINSYAHHP